MYKRFEKLLNERNLTMYRVAKDTGIATATFSEWKANDADSTKGYKPKIEKLQILADYFNVPLEYFVV